MMPLEQGREPEIKKDGRPFRLKWILFAAGCLGIAAVIAGLLFDRSLAAWCSIHLQSLRQDSWSFAVKTLGRFWVSLWMLFLFAWASGRRKVIPCGLIAFALAGATVLVLKPVIGRPRPDRSILEATLPPVEIQDYNDYSFPSGDSVEVMAIAVVLAAFLGKRWRPLPFVIAAGVAALRVGSARHYPSDVLGAAALGLICGYAALRLGW